MADVLAGRCAAVVTNPVAKSVLYGSGFSDPGHTEFLGKLASEHTGQAVRPVMMLWSDELAVVPVTIHLPLKDVPAALTTELIVETARTVARELSERFGVRRPRLALSGLNPHAGEDGALGREEQTIIAPAIKALQAERIDVRGPLPADTMFHASARATYDAALCMYHDQALIPIKMLAFDRARERHARPSLRAYLARPWHRLRHCRQRQSRSVEPDRGAQACRPHRRQDPGARQIMAHK